MMRGWAGLGKTGRMTSGIMPICSAVLATAMAFSASPSAYADDMGGLWPVKDLFMRVPRFVPLWWRGD